MKIFTSFIIKSNFFKAITSDLLSIRKGFFNISIISLLFLAACSDKSCIEANDFGEYETEYLSVSPTLSNANCTFTLQHPLSASDGRTEDQYYTPSPSFQLMKDSNDFESFMEIISDEYINLLSPGPDNVDQNKYNNFFTIFGGELQNYIVGEGKITGDNVYKEDYRNFLAIDVHQQDRVVVKITGDVTSIESDVVVNSRDEMLSFLLGKSDLCSDDNNEYFCRFLPNILYSYQWHPKSLELENEKKYLGCNMSFTDDSDPDLVSYDKTGSYNAAINHDSKKIKIKYPPLDIFLQCVEKAVEKCNNDKISDLNQQAAGYTSNDKISRSYPPASTSKYNPDVNDSLIITPESKIYVKALGEIILGGSVSYPNIFIDSFSSTDKTSLKFQNDGRQKKYLSDALNLSIESNWRNDVSDIYHISDSLDDDSLKYSYNALSRLVIYIGDYGSEDDEEVDIKEISAKLKEEFSDTEPVINYYVEGCDNTDANCITVVDLKIYGDSKVGNINNADTTITEEDTVVKLLNGGKIKVYINDSEISTGCNAQGDCIVDDIILKRQDVLKIEFKGDEYIKFPPTSTKRDGDSIYSDIFNFTPKSGYFISDKIQTSGLYEITHDSCNIKKIVNNYDFYNDAIEKELNPLTSSSKLYLRKGQRVLFANCSGSGSKEITLQHKRPAFICQKRIESFDVDNPFCTSGDEIYCVNRFHDNCVNGNNICLPTSSYTDHDSESFVNFLMEQCRNEISYDVQNNNNVILGKCSTIIDNECSSDTDPGQCKINCKSCMEETFDHSRLPKSSSSYDKGNIDICYDLEEYRGKLEELDYNNANPDDIKAIENIIATEGQYKGAKELTFNGVYGNFVNNGKFLLDPNPDDANQYYGSLNLLRSDILNFLVVNNGNLELDDSSFVDTENNPDLFEHDALIGEGNGYLIEFDDVDKIYKDGEMLESYLCYYKDGETTTPSCLTLETRGNILQSLDSEKLIAISSFEYVNQDDEYRNMCKTVTDHNSNFGYYFNEFGKLQEMNKSDMTYCPDIQEIPDNKYQTRKYYDNEENQINDSKNYQLYFSIIDDQENNCIIYDGSNGLSHGNCNPNKHYDYPLSNSPLQKCNGIRVENPYYTGCEDSNDYLISNPHFGQDSANYAAASLCPINCKIPEGDEHSLDYNQCTQTVGPINNIVNSKYLCANSCSQPNAASNSNNFNNFCQNLDPSKCIDKQYYCINKLMDNSGEYNLEVKVKDSSEFHGFMYSMLAPIIDLIYGSPITCVEGKRLFSQEGEYVGTCAEIDIVKNSVDISGQRQFDFRDRAKEYVVIHENNNYVTKYGKAPGKIVCKQGNLVDDVNNCNSDGRVEIKNKSQNYIPVGLLNIEIRENHIHQNGERIAHPEGGYILREDSMAQKVYQNIINNELFKTLLKTLMVVALSFYGGSYLMGMSEFSRTEIMSRVIRIAVVSLFLSPNGWVWFQNIFVNFFEKGGDYLSLLMLSAFESDELIRNSLNNNYFDPSILFSSFDKIISLFSLTMFYKITALFFTGITGWFYMLIIYWAIMKYFVVAFHVVTLYLSAKLFLNLTFLLAPILLLFVLFEQTKDTLNKWLKQMASFVLQQILILFTFSLFNSILYYLIKSVLAYKVCWGTVLSLDILVKISLFKWWTIAGDASPNLISILILFFMVLLMSDFIQSASAVAERIVDGITIGDIPQLMKKEQDKMFKSINSLYNQAVTKTGAGKYGIRDFAKKQILNYGKGAEEERESQLKLEKDSNALRRKMNKNADKAVAEFKVKSMSKEGDKLFSNYKQGSVKTNQIFSNQNDVEENKSDKMKRIEKIKKIRENAMINTIKNHYKSQGKDMTNDDAKKELNKLKNPNHNNANWSHDSISSLLLSKRNQRINNIDDTNKSIKQADLNSKDVKKAYQQLKKDGLTSEQIQERLRNPIDEVNELNKNKYRASRSDRFVGNLDDKLKREGQKEELSKQSKNRANNDADWWGGVFVNMSEDARDSAVDIGKDIKIKAKKAKEEFLNIGPNIINTSIESGRSIYTEIDGNIRGRLSSLRNYEQDIKDIRKSKERIESEKYLKKNGKIKAEQDHDLGSGGSYSSLSGYFVALGNQKFPILQKFGLREEWNPEEKQLVLALESKIKEKGGAENLQNRVGQIMSYYCDNNTSNENRNRIKTFIGKDQNDSLTKEDVKDFLISDDSKIPDWRVEISFDDFFPSLTSDQSKPIAGGQPKPPAGDRIKPSAGDGTKPPAGDGTKPSSSDF
jgi:type IV secretory pathway VirB6-like protein